MTTPLQLILDAFSNYYESLKDEEHYSYPKGEKNDCYWHNVWYGFYGTEGIETFIPYLFHRGLLPREIWNTYQELGNLPFKQLDDLVNKGRCSDVMDWLDTLMIQPHWAGSNNYQHLIKTGATLQEFLDSIKGLFENDYLVETQTKDYWKDYYYMQDEEIDSLFDYIQKVSKEHKLGLV